MVTGPNGFSTRFTLSGPAVTVGRGRGNDIVLIDRKASREHMRLERQGNDWYLLDLSSTNGVFIAGHRVTPGEYVPWSMDQEIVVGSHRVRAATAAVAVPARVAPPAVAAAAASSGHLDLRLEPATLTLAPGESGVVQVQIANRAEQAVTLNCRPENLPAAWLAASADLFVLQPGEEATISFPIVLPLDGVPAGDVPFRIVVDSADTLRFSQQIAGTIRVARFEYFELNVNKESYRDGELYAMAVRNLGNYAGIYECEAVDSPEELELQAPQWQVALTPGMEDALQVFVQPRRRPWLGRTRHIPLQFRVTSQDGESRTYEDSVAITPTLSPRRLLWLSILILVVTALTLLLTNLNQLETFARSLGWLATVGYWLESALRLAGVG
jgi:hypothetical protein